MSQSKILLAGYKDTDVSGQIPELFKRAGCTVEVMCGSNSWLIKNKYWDKWHKIDNKNSEIYTLTLEKLVCEQNYDWVVLTDDECIRVLSERITDPVLFQKILPMQKNEHKIFLGSKFGFSKICQKYNIPSPAFVIYDGSADLLVATKHLCYPILLKVDKSGGGNGVFLAQDALELLRLFNELSVEQKNNLVFQEYIVGDNISVEALFKNGKIIGFASSKILHNVQGEFSVSRVREFTSAHAVTPILSQLAEVLGLNGFASITFIRSNETETFYLIEADLRPHGWFYLDKIVGVDFSQLIKQYLAADLASAPIIVNTKPEIIKYFLRDIKWAVSERSFVTILHWIINKDNCWRFVPWHDQKLFRAMVVEVFKHLIYFIKPLRPVTRALKRAFHKIIPVR